MSKNLAILTVIPYNHRRCEIASRNAEYRDFPALPVHLFDQKKQKGEQRGSESLIILYSMHLFDQKRLKRVMRKGCWGSERNGMIKS